MTSTFLKRFVAAKPFFRWGLVGVGLGSVVLFASAPAFVWARSPQSDVSPSAPRAAFAGGVDYAAYLDDDAAWERAQKARQAKREEARRKAEAAALPPLKPGTRVSAPTSARRFGEYNGRAGSSRSAAVAVSAPAPVRRTTVGVGVPNAGRVDVETGASAASNEFSAKAKENVGASGAMTPGEGANVWTQFWFGNKTGEKRRATPKFAFGSAPSVLESSESVPANFAQGGNVFASDGRASARFAQTEYSDFAQTGAEPSEDALRFARRRRLQELNEIIAARENGFVARRVENAAFAGLVDEPQNDFNGFAEYAPDNAAVVAESFDVARANRAKIRQTSAETPSGSRRAVRTASARAVSRPRASSPSTTTDAIPARPNALRLSPNVFVSTEVVRLPNAGNVGSERAAVERQRTRADYADYNAFDESMERIESSDEAFDESFESEDALFAEPAPAPTFARPAEADDESFDGEEGACDAEESEEESEEPGEEDESLDDGTLRVLRPRASFVDPRDVPDSF